jgi:hypothetical protein
LDEKKNTAGEAEHKSVFQNTDKNENFDLEKFAKLNRLILRDLNKTKLGRAFARYTKDNIAKYIADPATYEESLIDAVRYIYGASSHFRRLIQYFASLTDLAYVVSPYRIDPLEANEKKIRNNYRKTLNTLSIMSIKTQFPKILTVCLREDVFYGTIWVAKDNITIQQLPSKYCRISSIEGNVFNVSFDFSYFDYYKDQLDYYPEEFRIKYELYKKNRARSRYIELDCPNSFAVKCNCDIPEYAMPPFAGILREIFDLEDYKGLKLTKELIENYALLVMKLPTDDEGNYLLDYDKARDFWENLDSVMPEEVGSVLSPMDIDKISFEKSNTGDTDEVSNAEQSLFSAAGVSSQLFNNQKASANALLLSIKADQAITYNLVKGIQDVVNRFIQHQSYGKYFHVEFLDVSWVNRKEAGDSYLKACTYGIPMISYYCASQGLGQAELDSMSYLETTILHLQDMFKPLRSSSTMSSSESDNEEGGAPTKEIGDLTDSGEQSREDSDDW